MPRREESQHNYEIRRDGTILCSSPIPLLGYGADKLKRIVSGGYKYYVDGKYQRKIE